MDVYVNTSLALGEGFEEGLLWFEVHANKTAAQSAG